jgi:hypothetical protein
MFTPSLQFALTNEEAQYAKDDENQTNSRRFYGQAGQREQDRTGHGRITEVEGGGVAF